MNRSPTRKLLMTASNRMLRNNNNHHQQVLVNGKQKKQTLLFSTSKVIQQQQQQQQQQGLKQWKQPFVECGADYRDHQNLEEYIGGPLYSEQKGGLRCLPVPTIEESIERFLPTALPLCRSQEEEESLRRAAADFVKPSSVAHKLQELLLQRKEEFDASKSNWLQLWWNQLAYLTYRDPVTIFVSYFFHFQDDTTLPTPPPPPKQAKNCHYTPNVYRAASIVHSMAEYRHQVCSGQKPCDQIGRGEKKKHLCSTAYKHMFHACRIPKPDEDRVRIYDPSLHNHILVARKGYFFTLEFLDKRNGNVLPLAVLEQRFQNIIDLADQKQKTAATTTPHYEVGYCTSSNRDDWAKARDVLLQQGGTKMHQALETLQSSAILINLDDEHPVTRKECAEFFLFGGRSGSSGKNRWMDKSVQVNIMNNGKAAFLGEHSMMDGMPMVTLADHLTKNNYQACKEKSEQQQQEYHDDNNNNNWDNGVTHVFDEAFQEIGLDNVEVSAVVEKAKNDYMKHISAHSLDVQSFHGYGSNDIKKFGYSPDAYVQIAMQLATYRLFGEQAGTYESTQTRPFYHGRTEVTRTVSEASSKFIKSLGMSPKFHEYNDTEQNQEKLRLLQEAVLSHVKYMSNAAQGHGVDRHFLGLSMFCNDNDPALQTPALFKDPVFIRSKRWRVSTSHLTHPKFENWGYGEVVPDGVGLSYSIHPRHCVFSMTALKEHGWTDKLSQLLEEAMIEMRTLVEMGGNGGDHTNNKKSKL